MTGPREPFTSLPPASRAVVVLAGVAAVILSALVAMVIAGLLAWATVGIWGKVLA